MATLSRAVLDIAAKEVPATLDRPSFAAKPREERPHGVPGHKVLLLAASYTLPYRVLRCAKACAAQVYVLGDLGAQVLRLSRFCDRFVRSSRIINGAYDEALALEINVLARDLGITAILAGDAPSTRALIACRNQLHVDCFPMPRLEQFDQLNDKWRFSQLCDEIGLNHPRTQLFSSIDDATASVLGGALNHPLVLKPLSLSGSQGIMHVDRHNAAAQLARLNYEPIIVQDFVSGRDMSVSIYCHRGKVQGFVMHERRRRIFSTFWNQTIYDELLLVAARLELDGIFNFDMIVTDDGRHHYLECNPRFFFSISLAMLAGLNFITLGLKGDSGRVLQTIPAGLAVRAPEAILTSPRSWSRLGRRDLRSAAFVISDPLPLLFDQLGWPA